MSLSSPFFFIVGVGGVCDVVGVGIDGGVVGVSVLSVDDCGGYVDYDVVARDGVAVVDGVVVVVSHQR